VQPKFHSITSVALGRKIVEFSHIEFERSRQPGSAGANDAGGAHSAVAPQPAKTSCKMIVAGADEAAGSPPDNGVSSERIGGARPASVSIAIATCGDAKR